MFKGLFQKPKNTPKDFVDAFVSEGVLFSAVIARSPHRPDVEFLNLFHPKSLDLQ